MDKKRFFFILNNLFIFVTMSIAVPVTLIIGSRASRIDNLGNAYWEHIVTFTILSNIFLGIVALISAIIAIARATDKRPLPKSLSTWYLTATSAGLLTMFTVVLFLAPMRAINGKNYFDMLLETMFFLHFFNPFIAAITFIFLLGGNKVSLKSRLIATLPAIVYAIPYMLCVVPLRIWPDFYGITFGGRYYLTPLVIIVFWLAIFGIATGISYLHDKKASKNTRDMLKSS